MIQLPKRTGVVIPLKRFLKWNSEVLCRILLNNLVPFASLAVLLKIIYRHPIKALVGMVGGLVGGLLIRLTYWALLWLYRRFTFVRRECSICNEIIEYGESAEQLAACHGHEMHHQCLLHWAANGNPEFTGAGGRGCRLDSPRLGNPYVYPQLSLVRHRHSAALVLEGIIRTLLLDLSVLLMEGGSETPI